MRRKKGPGEGEEEGEEDTETLNLKSYRAELFNEIN